MLKLKFREGAVVTFGLTCNSNLDTTGKVIFADENEVVYIPQNLVSEIDYEDHWGCQGIQLDTYHTVDEGQPIHLDRSLIASWKYYSVIRQPKTTYYGIIKKSELLTIDEKFISNYDENGFCCGNGDFIDK